jgi:ribosomal protein L29
VSDEQLASIGGVRRQLAEILTEVAEGRSELTYMGG